MLAKGVRSTAVSSKAEAKKSVLRMVILPIHSARSSCLSLRSMMRMLQLEHDRSQINPSGMCDSGEGFWERDLTDSYGS